MSAHRRVPLQTAAPSLRTVQLTVVFSPEKFCAGALTATTFRSAGRATTSAATVRLLLVSFDSVSDGYGGPMSLTTVT